MAISGHHSKASLGNYIGRPSSEKIRACSDILSDTLYESIEHADDTVVRFGNKVCFEN